MTSPSGARDRAVSHSDYLQTLHPPSAAEARRISEIQIRRESDIKKTYHQHTAEEHEAATKIQRTFRGHRERRQLNGLTLDPSSRWVDIMKELRYRTATAPHCGPSASRLSPGGRPRASSDIAKLNWQRATQVAEHAGAGEPGSPSRTPNDFLDNGFDPELTTTQQEATISMLLDLRYFLEMIDQKHRYGTNLQVYHEEWLRSKANQNFFYWLDHGDGKHLSLPGCNRQKLDKERIRYLSRDERKDYLVRVDEEGKLRWRKNDELITTSVDQFKDSMRGIVPKDDLNARTFADEEVARQLADDRRFALETTGATSPDSRRRSDVSGDDSSESAGGELAGDGTRELGAKKRKKPKHFHVSPATILNHLLRASIKPGTWIYVCDTIGRLYVSIKSSGAFQHASFLSGARISSAGSIGIENGRLTYLSPLSGHYRPTTKSFTTFIASLKRQGVDLNHLKVSKAYEVLLGMEYYGKTKKGVRSVVKPRKQDQIPKRPSSPEPDQQLHDAANTVPGPSLLEQSWQREHKHGLGKLMDDLHIRRRSADGRRDG